MSVRVNPSFFRLALATIQPANADSVRKFVQDALGTDGHPIDLQSIRQLLDTWENAGDIVCVHKRFQLFSLTKQGDSKLNRMERRLRDRTRLFLLKEARAGKLAVPEAGEIEKADASSAVTNDPAIQEEERPIDTAAPPRRARSAVRAYWPLLSQQLLVGSSVPASGPLLRFLSFQSERACSEASGTQEQPSEGIDSHELALALGISPRLIGVLLHQPERHYRTFEIPKANGKPRVIRAPRTMMKVVQYFLLDYILRGLPVHQAATAYGTGCSNRANAMIHVGQRYVANIDVSNFFPSLTTKTVCSQLFSAGLKTNTAALVARLCSYQGGLPQGAPTSAALSNIALFDFDTTMSEHAEKSQVRYTRYADDITFSGDNIDAISFAISLASKLLKNLGLELNQSKTRIFGPSNRKVVTGVVVNVWAQPSRHQRRKLRAALHHAALRPDEYAQQISELQGRAAYMLSFSSESRSIGALPKEYVHRSIRELKKHMESQR